MNAVGADAGATHRTDRRDRTDAHDVRGRHRPLVTAVVANHHTRPFVIRARQIASPWRALPDYVIIGAQKAATTALAAALANHPRVVPGLVKETRYFDRFLARGTSWYRAHFPLRRTLGTGPDRCLTGEATPEYLDLPWVPAALHATLPEARLVALLRDPVDRAVSHYHHSVSRDEEWLDIEAAFDAEARRLAAPAVMPATPPAVRHSRYGYVTRGHYAEQLERWFAVVGRSRLLVCFHDDLVRDPHGTLATVQEFLGLPVVDVPVARLNERSYDDVPRALRAQLESHFAPHDRRLTELLGRALPWAPGAAASQTS